jgi:hypothetical protein
MSVYVNGVTVGSVQDMMASLMPILTLTIMMFLVIAMIKMMAKGV